MPTGIAAPPEPSVPHNLPMQADELLGRDDELTTARDAILESGYRLLTLLGPGGIGKTRLALGIGSILADRFKAGSWFVDLTRTGEASGVSGEILTALGGIADRPGQLNPLKRRLNDAGDILIILDNFEHVIAAAPTVAHILEACPLTRFIVTSREPLRLTWEQRLVVPPLSVPDLRHLPSADEVMAIPAVALFMRHASAINPSFVDGSGDLQAIAELCVRLEGVPLAIELAATRANVLTPASILERLDGSQTFLHASIRDAPDRHQSIEATLDWSFDLLTEPERVAFRRLGTFVGSFTYEAAAIVLERGADDTLEVLSSLVDKAFLSVNRESDGGLRYALRTPVRAYARERLELAGEVDRCESDHALYYRDWMRKESRRYRHAGYLVFSLELERPGAPPPGSTGWAEILSFERGNIDLAMDRLANSGDEEAALDIAAALQWFWSIRGSLRDSIVTMRQAVNAATDAPADLKADALHGLGLMLRQQQSFPDARVALELSISLAREAPSLQLACRSLVEYGVVMLSLGRLDEARGAITEAQALWASDGDRWGVAAANAHLSLVETLQGHLGRAETLGKAAAAEMNELGDSRSLLLATVTAAHAGLLAGKQPEANDLLFSCVETARHHGEPGVTVALLEVVGRSLAEKGETGDAATLVGTCRTIEASGLRRCWGLSQRVSGHPLAASQEIVDSRVRESFSQEEAPSLDHALDVAERALLADSVSTPKPSPKTESVRGFLSPREHEVLQLVSLGRSNREIARNIFVSESTVKFHVTSILNKLGANTRTEAVSSAMRRGILSIEDPDEAVM